MRIALIQPPVEDFYQTAIRTQPVGLLYLASALEQQGHAVTIFDFLACREKRAIPFPSLFAYLKPHFALADVSPVRTFKHYYHFGAGWDEITRCFESREFDAYGITCMFTPFQRQADQLASILRKLHPRRPIFAGGTHATSCPERLLHTGLYDGVFAGEAELSLPAWLASFHSAGETGAGCVVIPGHTVEDLDALPFPARHCVDLDRYRIDGVRSTMLITSRGCPYRCTFCAVHQTMGHVFRARSAGNVLQEIRECVEKYGILHFDIEDDNFTFDQPRAAALMTEVLDTFGEGTLRFSAMNGLTATDLNPKLLQRMRQAGFRHINLSLVASQGSTLRRLKRPVSFSGFCATVQAARSADLNCTAYFIAGLPGDNASRMLETLLALAEQPLLVGPSIFYLSPGTELFEQFSAILPEELELLRSSTFYAETGDSTLLERMTLFRLTRLVNFLKGRLDSGGWRDEKADVAARLRAPIEDEGTAPARMVGTHWSALQFPSQGRRAADPALGWAVASLLAETLHFHAVERNKGNPASGYLLVPLPTSQPMVSEFLALSRGVTLRGACSEAAAPLWEMLDTQNVRSVSGVSLNDPKAAALPSFGKGEANGTSLFCGER